MNNTNFLDEVREYNTGSINIGLSNIANGSIFGSKISWVTGRSGYALQTSGITADGEGYVRISGGLNDFFNPNNGAVSLWIKNPSPGSGGDFIFNGTTNTRTRMLCVGEGSIAMIKGNPGLSIVPATALINGDWNHCVLTWEPSGAVETNGSYWGYGYINNILTGSGVFRDTTSGVYYALFGINPNGGEPSNVSIDDFRVYNKTLAAANVDTLFNNGSYSDQMIIHLKMDENTGSIAYDYAQSLVTKYTEPINGTIQNITLKSNDTNDTGSIQIMVSGTNESLLVKTVGLTSDVIRYPYIYSNDINGNSGSPWTQTNYTVNGPLFIVGSMLGGSTSITNIKITYN